MYTLLIVDDEPIIADGLYEELKEYGEWEIDVHRVYSGKAALELLGRMRIDIVISDIRMPGLDGIGLLKQVKSSWPSCRMILLTGHRDFDYALGAMEYGAIRYILKTEGYDKVIETVRQTIAEINQSLRYEKLLAEAGERLQAMNAMLTRELLAAALRGELEAGAELAERLDTLGPAPDPARPVWLAVCRFDQPFAPTPSGYLARKTAMETIRLIAEQLFSPLIHGVMTAASPHLLVWLLQDRVRDAELTELGQPAGQPGLFIRETIETIQRAVKETLGLTVSFAVSTDGSEWERIAETQHKLALLLEHRSAGETELLRTDKQDPRAQDIVTRIKAYVEAHLHEDISLVKLADLVHFNPTYLSRFFKQRTGFTLSEFVQEVRLERARQLLADPDMRVADIAEALGYGSASNFARSFKKAIGLAPQEFRESTAGKQMNER